ncbi:Poly [ADP-ribose] polymerase 2 [Cichlidogyrus casuarinus]|uniref:Poly [ADP-ribose] polymerase n=1 Tax=Cichlidogyrus casuarinus TaxID=1844966 RepID=A0ABD2Q626_9PLAT
MKRKSTVPKTKDKDDSSAPVKKKIKKESPKKGVRKALVDSFCHAKIGKANVYVDGDVVYDVMLNQTNIGHNNNKYYLIQLLQDHVGNGFSVWFRWGRVGAPGQNKLETYSDVNMAKSSFMSKFKDKTKNDWNNRNSFVKVPGKYDLVEIDVDEEEEEEATDTRPKKVDDVPSKLEEQVKVLMNLICDVKRMEAQMAVLNYDAKKAPLGKLSKKQLQLGYESLKNISNLITEMDSNKKSKSGKKRVTENKTVSAATMKMLQEACSEFYTRIPHNFGMKLPPVIQTPQEVKEKLELLEALENIDFAMKVINKSSSENNEHPLDRNYKQLECDIKPLAPSNKTRKLVEKYIDLTHAPTHSIYKLQVLDVFEICKSKEEPRFKKELGNRMLLWHGSRLSNWMGILGKGLCIAPPEAPVNGYMFGKGIYFADACSKSANYVCATRDNDVGLLVLCEVALGELDERKHSCCKLPNEIAKGKDSVIGLGSMIPDKATWSKLDDGTVVPCGKIVKRDAPTDASNASSGMYAPGYSLLYNEYIVYDVAQVKMRYLVKTKFQFN